MIMVMIMVIVFVLIIIIYFKMFFSPILSYVCLTFAHIKFLHISLNIVRSGCNPSNFHVILQTTSPKRLNPFPHIPNSHLHIFARRLPIILFLTLNISKPPKPVISYHLSHGHGLNTQTAAQFFTLDID